MSLDAAVRTTTLVDEIAFRIEKAILDGELASGSELNQEELCARLGVSRTPVREALRKLDAQGLVLLRPNRSAIVRRRERVEVVDLYRVRAELEGYACELACARPIESYLIEIEESQVELETAATDLHAIIHANDPAREARLHERLRNANDRFHQTILDACGSPVLAGLVMQLWNAFPKDYVWRTLLREEDEFALHSKQHRRILAGLRDGDAARARAAMAEHVELSGQLLVAHLDQQGFWTPDATAGPSYDDGQEKQDGR
jgi:DNA-binding GntR family transcriptional regulator